MTAQNELRDLAFVTSTATNDDEYSIPLDISDIISICREYNKLGWQIQGQVESILDVGVEEALKTGKVKQQSLPYIRGFLHSICKNAYFGDAISQAEECIYLIDGYISTAKSSSGLN